VTETEGDEYTETVDTTVPIIDLYSPTEGATYDSRRVRLNMDVDEEVLLEYSDNGGRFRRLCRRCDHYDRTRSFSDGSHSVVITATDKAGNVATETVNFEIV